MSPMHQPSPHGADLAERVQPGQHRLQLGRGARWSDHAATAFRLARKVPWQVPAALALAALIFFAVSRIPFRERLRMEAHFSSYFTDAPVLILGDSITYQAAPHRLCGEKAFNAAIPGDRVADLLRDAKSYASRLTAQRVVIAIGANDAWPRHRSLGDWKADYRHLLAAYRGRDLVLVEINPPDPAKNPIAGRLDLDFIAAANDAIRTIAAEAGARVVTAPKFLPTKDGLHPSPEGVVLWRGRLAQTACVGTPDAT